MNPICAVGFVTFSLSMKGATGSPSSFSLSLCEKRFNWDYTKIFTGNLLHWEIILKNVRRWFRFYLVMCLSSTRTFPLTLAWKWDPTWKQVQITPLYWYPECLINLNLTARWIASQERCCIMRQPGWSIPPVNSLPKVLIPPSAELHWRCHSI